MQHLNKSNYYYRIKKYKIKGLGLLAKFMMKFVIIIIFFKFQRLE